MLKLRLFHRVTLTFWTTECPTASLDQYSWHFCQQFQPWPGFQEGHGELLELRLLEKSARHDFIIARHHSSNNIFSCHLLESSLARINWIRAVDKKSVEQLISCQKCRAIACRAIAIRAVHPHSFKSVKSVKSKPFCSCRDFLDCQDLPFPSVEPNRESQSRSRRNRSRPPRRSQKSCLDNYLFFLVKSLEISESFVIFIAFHLVWKSIDNKVAQLLKNNFECFLEFWENLGSLLFLCFIALKWPSLKKSL